MSLALMPPDLGVLPPAREAGPAVEDAEALLARLERLGRAASGALPLEDAAALDALACWCARGGGAHEVAVGEGLDLLARSGAELRLGFSSIGDLARERLGIAAWEARRLRRNAVALRERPLLREAVVSGEVSARKAEVIRAVAVGADEAYWVARARVETVRRLEAAVSCPEHLEEDWHRIRLALPREEAELVDGALDVAKVVLGPGAPMWKCLWALAAEFLGTHPSEPLEPACRQATAARGGDRTERGAAGSGSASGSASARGASGPGPVSAPEPAPVSAPAQPGWPGPPDARPAASSPAVNVRDADPYRIVEQLARLLADRAAAEGWLGRACLLVRRLGVARQLGWSCFEEWCVERLGLAPATVYQRMALERRLAALPELREALRARRLSYEQARLVARGATPADVAARIEDAAGKSCIALVRELEAEERLQMCDAGELRAVVPEDVGSLLSEAIRAARLHAERRLTPGEALVEIALHFIQTWAPEVLRLVEGAHPVILRDEGLCRIPGCSRPAAHVHHTWFRSAGGPLEPWNELSLCLPHHLLGVHAGNVLVTGRAPDGLTFVLGEREVARARARG